MIGFTLCSPGFWDHTQKAVDSFTAMTGLPCAVGVTSKDDEGNEGNYLAKMQCPVRGQTVVYFDSDVRWRKPVNLKQFDNQKEFIAVPDCVNHPLNHRNHPGCFSYHDVRLLGIDFDKYFNAGFMIWNDRHLAAIHHGLKNFGKIGPVKDYGDQIYFNWAIKDTKTPLRLLSNAYNAIIGGSTGQDYESVHPDPYMLHAAGVPIEEKNDLLDHAVWYYRDVAKKG